MKTYITETWLREHGAMAAGTCLRLPPGSVLTPAARTLAADRRLQIVYEDEAGGGSAPPGKAAQGKAADSRAADSAARPRVHPLTGRERGERPPAARCALCRQDVGKKPDALTHLDADTLVPKNDARIRFRGRLDSAIACAVWLQAEWEEKRRAMPDGAADPLFTRLERGLADVRSALGAALRAEVTGEALPPPRMGPFDEEAIHRVSHDPWRYLGHDHVVPEVSQGLSAARLNLLRAAIREAEACAAEVYVGRDFEVDRPDIMRGLNRLSSAVYILMILAIMRERRAPLKEGAWD
ncbi:MAG: ethanolamine utilization cob(I)yrinic acid a,c-diamide adenosyltransferase EutT [Candidatus Accumulibacter sp.]|jgi:ethanolamine utilization cobalamin adenosyltransferase|nr:ethanolamine utilization cob(I)yrinic acid a,c-diamide adenosyltransferase EutT [Accumulibacter sp.]